MPFSMEYINIKYKHKTYKYVGFSPVTSWNLFDRYPYVSGNFMNMSICIKFCLGLCTVSTSLYNNEKKISF